MYPMSKIKQIQQNFSKNPEYYIHLRLRVAQKIFVICVSLYFLVRLFTVGGFYFWIFDLPTLATCTYHLFSLAVIATFFLAYSYFEYMITLYKPKMKFLLILAALICLVSV